MYSEHEQSFGSHAYLPLTTFCCIIYNHKENIDNASKHAKTIYS